MASSVKVSALVPHKKYHASAIDLFSGAGGLSHGLIQAGFEVKAAVDNDPIATRTYDSCVGSHITTAPIEEISAQDILSSAGLGVGDCTLLAGGPPCQGFSLQRRGERQDPRNTMVLQFVRMVEEIKPRFFLMENVGALFSKHGTPFLRELSLRASRLGYVIHTSVLNAADFGVPQTRRRAFLVGEYTPDFKPRFRFPDPITGPKRTVRDAIGDLPSSANTAGLLSARTHPAEATAPDGKTPEGQLRDQRMTPFLKRAGFGELLLESPGATGAGYWSVPTEVREIVQSAVSAPPVVKTLGTAQEWIEWFCEGTAAAVTAVPPPPPPAIEVPVANLTLASLKRAIEKYETDLSFSDKLLASLVAALRAGDGKSFIILRGVSGTGKSRLVSAVAKAVYGSSAVDRPHLTILEVRPDWTDGAPLLGHFDPVGQRYVREPFLDALIAAQGSDAPVFVCLDEMNLARVEYYLAECLSAMESGNPITLDVRGDSSVPARVRWPKNLFLFGTINIDESTLRISDKVLDRAQVIDTSDIDLLRHFEAVAHAGQRLRKPTQRLCW
jgi:DNA-cytosine methyltransferase